MTNENMKSLREKVEQYAASLGTSIKELFDANVTTNDAKDSPSLTDKVGQILGTKPMNETSSSKGQREETTSSKSADALDETATKKPSKKDKPKTRKQEPKYKDDDGKLWVRASPKWTKEQKEKYRLAK